MRTPPMRRRLEALAPRLHKLGERPLAELLIDIARETGEPEAVLAVAERFAQLSPAIVKALRADCFTRRLVAVPERAA